MFKTFYLRNMSLHSLPRFTSKIRNILVGNSQFGNVIFIIQFETLTLTLEKHDDVDFILGNKNVRRFN